ncbi:MAG: PadR family transcriptional regulator [Candidatus Eiseniibacteriota bacterium]
MGAERLKGNLDLLLLATVDAGEAHGYAIVEALRRRSDGVFDLPEGTIYPALHRLERAGWLRSLWREQEGRRRRVYQITARGQRALGRQREEWSVFARAVRAIAGGST